MFGSCKDDNSVYDIDECCKKNWEGFIINENDFFVFV